MGYIPKATPPTAVQITGLLDLIYPVGSIFEWAPAAYSNVDLSTAEKVAAYLGGRWEAYGAGLVTVGVQAGDPDFGKAGQTGGEKAHLLTEPEMPSHNHVDNDRIMWTDVGGGGMKSEYNDNANIRIDNGQQVTQWTGGGQPHNNMPPYVVVYRYWRIG